MAASSKKKYEVVLNAGAMGSSVDASPRVIEADRFQRDPNNQSITFYEGDEEVAYFQYVTAVCRVSDS